MPTEEISFSIFLFIYFLFFVTVTVDLKVLIYNLKFGKIIMLLMMLMFRKILIIQYSVGRVMGHDVIMTVCGDL